MKRLDNPGRRRTILARKRISFPLGRKGIYLVLAGLLCLVLFLVFGLPLLLGPSLSKSQQEWREFTNDDPQGYPLEVVSHGFRMIQAYRREVPSSSAGQPRSINVLEWEWKIAVKNKSWRDLEVYVQYALVDKERLMVDLDSTILQRPAPSGETVEITHQSEMLYQDLPRVATGVWEISWQEGKTVRHSRRKGF
jgi:hypothetical protein